MIRKGRFALWNNKEYKLISYQCQYYLQSRCKEDLKNGFSEVERKQGVFVKKVAVLDLEDAYEVFPFAMVLGHRFTVEGYNQKTDTIALVTTNPFVQEKVAVRPYGKFEYIIEIRKEEVTIQEDRISILGFENI